MFARSVGRSGGFTGCTIHIEIASEMPESQVWPEGEPNETRQSRLLTTDESTGLFLSAQVSCNDRSRICATSTSKLSLRDLHI